VLRDDGELVLCRTWHDGIAGERHSVLTLQAVAEQPTPDVVNRLAHEYELKDQLDDSWAIRPIEFVRERERTLLVLESPRGVPLDHIEAPLELGLLLRLAVDIAVALGRLHERGLIHKDIKPANIFVNTSTGQAWLTGFGIASRVPRERQAPDPPEFIAGTLAYMAPEQTGRMNGSIDSRSDLYSLGVTLYQVLTGTLPFTASDPMGWVHCHIARKPTPPGERLEHVPDPVSAIIMKLLAKTAEERYQTAAGLESDLRRCLEEWENRQRIDDFLLGEHDRPDRLLIPEKLYGRAAEIQTLLACFDRVVANGTPELVLVAGYSGIGKSSVVNELHKVLVPPRGLFASGKFDQYQRDIPYATLAQAFQRLVRPLLSKPETELRIWRDALREALGPNGLLIVNLVPELMHIIAEQPPISVLPPQDAQRRFQLVLRRFIGVFARPEHPLALFLDDLQWLDAATLDLLEDLLSHPVQHLMLIGAYRDNEVDSTHPLLRRLEAIRKAGAAVQEIVLAPLARADLQQLLADSLRCEPQRSASLANLVHEKTGGNPFFVIQFLTSLAEEGLLHFEHRPGQWSWDLRHIHAKGYTDNVVDLVVAKLSRLPLETQEALQLLACIGNHAEFALLQIVSERASEDMHGHLQEALRAGLLFRSEDSYWFLHDRVQEAAYSLIPEALRPAAHLRIGRLLAAAIPSAEREKKIFDIVNQLNRGTALISSRDERERLAELNLIAGERAKASTAYASALTYFITAAGLLAEDCWERRHETAFRVELGRAECEFLTGQLPAAQERLLSLSSRAANPVELATVTCLRMNVYTIRNQNDCAVAACLDYLRQLGIEWSAHPTEDEARREYARIQSQLGSRAIEQLIELPPMSDPVLLATLDVLTEVLPLALFSDANLLSLAICRSVNLSLEQGNSNGSCVAYTWLGQIAGPHFGDYRAGFRFGQLGYRLAEKKAVERFQARTYMVFASHVMPWTRHVRGGRDLIHRAFEIANRIGDLTFAAYSGINLNAILLAAGEPLSEVECEARKGLVFAQKARFGFAIDAITGQLQLIRTLRGCTPQFGSFDDGQFEELRFEQHLGNDRALAQPECYYWIRKLQARFLAGDPAQALDAASRAQRLLWSIPSNLEVADYHFYSALSHAASWDCASPEQKLQHLAALAAHHEPLGLAAENCPDNFDSRGALVAAEIARIEHRPLDAERLYEQAIRSAHANGLVHNEALAYETAARFYAARGFDRFAHVYLLEARRCYLRWGANGKVSQLERLLPQLREETPAAAHTSTIGAPVESLDLATVIKLSQAMSGEMVLDKLIHTLMRTAIEHAGAERGVLVLTRGDQHRTVAEATINADTITVGVRESTVTAADLPESVLQYVFRTKQPLLLHDASSEESFAADQYILRHHARSILCLPLLKEHRLIGVLYLENHLTPHVFTSSRMVVLKLLASEAAIALENIRLYGELQEREAKVRRLVDSNIIGSVIWCADGRIIDANEAFLRMVEYDRDDLLSGRLRWSELTPVEWRETDEERAAELQATGTVQPYEKEYLRKSGTRVAVLIGAASFAPAGQEGVAFVIDLTDRKRAETQARESERRYREVEMALVHANRVATLGQMLASIAHEINQPVAATVTNAQAALRFLDGEHRSIEEVRQALSRIARLGNRVVEVIGRIRALVRKVPSRQDTFDINEAIDEVISLTQGELVKNGVCLHRDFAPGLPLLRADRVELQQVVLNLITNAVEAMSGLLQGQRELRISTGRVGDQDILIAVQDSGPGLDPANFNRVFEPFYSTKQGGLGIGLSICRAIIEAHGGRLWVESNQPRGAMFAFTLPRAPVVLADAENAIGSGST
jgi:PAS domain S-box-containing protein